MLIDAQWIFITHDCFLDPLNDQIVYTAQSPAVHSFACGSFLFTASPERAPHSMFVTLKVASLSSSCSLFSSSSSSSPNSINSSTSSKSSFSLTLFLLLPEVLELHQRD